MIPEKRALAQLARLRARSGAAPEVVSQLCLRLRTLGDSRPEDPEIAFLEALGKTNGTRADALEAAEVLEALWARRDELDLALAADVGRAAGVVLFRVGDAPMAQRAQRIFTALSELDLPGAERRLYATMSRIGPNPSGADLGRPPVARPAPPPERAVLPGMPVVKPGTRPPRPAPNGPAVKAPAAAVEVMKEMTKEERQELRAQQATLTPQQRKALRKLLVGKSADEVAALQQKLADMPMKEREQFLQRVVTDR
jgi:hypothetical protein